MHRQATKRLIKTIEDGECEVFAIVRHDRLSVGHACAKVEVYENHVEVPTIGGASYQVKKSLPHTGSVD